MSASYRIDLKIPATVADWLAPVRAYFRLRPGMFPGGEDGTPRCDDYKRKQLDGSRAMPAATYLRALEVMYRRSGRDYVAAAVNVWLARFGLVAVPLLLDPKLKPVKEEIFDAFAATAKALTEATEAIADGSITPAEKQNLHVLFAATYCQMAEAERALERIA